MMYEPCGAIPTPIDVAALWADRGKVVTSWVCRVNSSLSEGSREVRFVMADRRKAGAINEQVHSPQYVLDSDRRGRVRSMTEKSFHFQPSHNLLTDSIVNYLPADQPPQINPARTGVHANAVNLYMTTRQDGHAPSPSQLVNMIRLRRAITEVDGMVQFVGGSVADLRDALAELSVAVRLSTQPHEKVADAVAITRRVGALKHFERRIDLPAIIRNHGEAVYNLNNGIERGATCLFPGFEALWLAHAVCMVDHFSEGAETPYRPVRLEGAPGADVYARVAENIIRTAMELHFASALTLIATGGSAALPEYGAYRARLADTHPLLYQDVTTSTVIPGQVTPVMPLTATRNRRRIVR